MGVKEAESLLNEGDKSEDAVPFWKRKIKKIAGHASLFLILVLYTVFGGIIFKELEYPTEVERLVESDNVIRQKRSEFLQVVTTNHSTEDFASFLNEQLQLYEEAMQSAAQGGVLVPLSQGTSPSQLARWNNLQAIFFASTVLTTIGYGNIVPVTSTGRIFCLVYALIGIPLCVSVIADMGSLVAASFSGLPSWVEKIPATVKSLVSAGMALGLLLLYISVGAVLFMFLEEDWSFFESFYFCFITMTTIGFGDLVPQKPEYMLLCTVYILIGLGLTSTIIEIVRNEYAKSWKRLQTLAEALRKLGESSGTHADINALQSDLRKAIAGLSEKGSGWESAFDNLVKTMAKPKSDEPKIIQIIVYESSV